MVEFNHDDDAYVTWLQMHPDGYVANVRRKLSPDFVVLHRASCDRIVRSASPGALTGLRYRKLCGTNRRDIADAPARCGRPRGAFTAYCKVCKPEREDNKADSQTAPDIASD